MKREGVENKKYPEGTLNGNNFEIKANKTKTDRAWKGYFEEAKAKGAKTLVVWIIEKETSIADIYKFVNRIQPKRYGVNEVIAIIAREKEEVIDQVTIK